MATHHNQIFNAATKVNLNKRLEDTGWGLFLLLLGCLLLLPGELVPRGTWLIGAGLIMLALNATRYFNHIRISPFTVVLGIFAVILGLATFLGLELPLIALFLIVIGVTVILRSLFTNRD